MVFSFFDALCAESTGIRIFPWPNFSSSSSSSNQFDRRTSSASSPAPAATSLGHDHALKKENSLQEKNSGKENSQRMMAKPRNPRFAVELDGIHCFETIVPY